VGALAVALVCCLFLINLPDLQAQTGGALGYGSKVYGAVSAESPVVTYSFSGQAGDYVVMQADSWTGTLDIQLEFVGPNGQILDSSTHNPAGDQPFGAFLTTILPDAGLYVLRVSGENNTAGDYLLTVLGRAAVTAAPLIYGQPVAVTVTQGAAPQFFTFEAEDCPTTLVVSDPSEGQPHAFPFVVKLRDQRGQSVALLRGGDQLEDWVTVEANSVRYEVEVLGADPALSGSLRLLVTCAGQNPGCTTANVPPGEIACAPCPPREPLVPGSTCPDLNFVATQDPAQPNRVTVTWNPMPGATGYAVYVIGRMLDGEVYLTHGTWVPGDPLTFTWLLPEVGYIAFDFSLRALVDDVVLCTDDAIVEITSQQAQCPDMGLTAIITEPVTRALTLNWLPDLGADQFAIDIYTTIGGGESYNGRLVIDADQTSYAYDHFPPDAEAARFVLWMTIGGALCSDEVTVDFDQPPGQQPGVTCAVRAEREGVNLRVGPSTFYAIFTTMPPGIDYLVIGQAVDGGGMAWWELDKTQFTGHETVDRLWVAQSVVVPVGDCSQVPVTEIPQAVIPWPQDEPPPDEPPPGQWLPCGSCDTCGQPANECVTSPDGQCLWDPATCRGVQPLQPGGEPSPNCYSVSVSIDMGSCYSPGSAMLDTPPNCEGGLFVPGTLIQAHAVAVDPKCTVQSWSGCGVSSGDESVSFVPPGSCALVAHMGY
jgi:hypothetical protein